MTPILESESESVLLRALTVESHRILDGEATRHPSPLAERLAFALALIVAACLIAFVAYGPGAPK